MRRLPILLLFLITAACASIEAKTPAQRVFAVNSDYAALLSVAVAYESQPRCVPEKRSGCSDTKIVAEIRRADDAAYAALKAAKDTVRTPGVSDSTVNLVLTGAVNAVGALRSILYTYGVLK